MSATKKAENKKEFTMVQVFALWKSKAKSGAEYLTGKTGDGLKLTGFFNTKKKNPKEPDLRVYTHDSEGNLNKDVYVSMWCNVSKNDKKYLTGKIGDKRIVGFIRKTENEKAPYVSVYYSEEQKEDKDQVTIEETTNEELPF